CYQMLLIKLRFYIKKTPIYGCFFIFIFTKKWIFVLKLGNSGITIKATTLNFKSNTHEIKIYLLIK
ncbi:hypothetical protein, partial [Mesomycoplasma ovipneumoniae]|uniref:hypothetical protein n=1 Tax=Mesomycoplasma ovipneumoniae TaxID=29562 RepID=UPI003080FDCC